MNKILFVCSGNTCRSPFAHYYFNKLANERNIDSSASSAGLFTYGGECVCENALSASMDFGTEKAMKSHRSTPLTAKMLLESDYIIAMGSSHLTFLENMIKAGVPVKGGQKRILLGKGISDPYGGSVSDYKKCYKQIADQIETFIEANY